METPSPGYIISRSLAVIALIAALLFSYDWFKRKQRRDAIARELTTLTSDSQFFRQFYAEDARKALVRAVGLVFEAESLGMTPDAVIDLGLGIKPRLFENELQREPPSPRENIIRNTLRSNYDHLLKLGFQPIPRTFGPMLDGELPAIPSGPHSGRRPEIRTIIRPELSPGLDKVVGNLEIHPPDEANAALTDIQLAAAKRLATELAQAGIIEDQVRERIIAGLSKGEE